MLGEHMESEILKQPEVLRANAGRYFEEAFDLLGEKKPEMVLLAARGSSDNAALYARYLTDIHLGIPAVLASPSVWTRYGANVKYPKCLAIGVSQSGEAEDVAAVLGALRKDGHGTLAITNTPDSPLTHVAEFTLQLGAERESSVAATKTYTASLLALYQVVRALAVNPSHKAVRPVLPDPASQTPTDEWVVGARTAAEDSVGVLLRSEPIFSLARGYGFSTAEETALKLMECAQLPAKSYSTADFQHGPKALACHGTAAIVFGEPAEWLKEQGCAVVMAPEAPERLHKAITPIWDVVFGQWLALLAARARGLDADDPQFLTKVTRTL